MFNSADWFKIFMILEPANDPVSGENSIGKYKQLRKEIDEIVGEGAMH